jgi:hypothetical protein
MVGMAFVCVVHDVARDGPSHSHKCCRPDAGACTVGIQRLHTVTTRPQELHATVELERRDDDKEW